MEIVLIAKQKVVNKKIETDHYWYDQANKVMLHGRGGRMIFKYDSATKKAFPVLVDEYEKRTENNIQELNNFVERWSDAYDLEVVNRDKNSITIKTLGTSAGSLMDKLLRDGITFDYDENEWKRELRGLLRWQD